MTEVARREGAKGEWQGETKSEGGERECGRMRERRREDRTTSEGKEGWWIARCARGERGDGADEEQASEGKTAHDAREGERTGRGVMHPGTSDFCADRGATTSAGWYGQDFTVFTGTGTAGGEARSGVMIGEGSGW